MVYSLHTDHKSKYSFGYAESLADKKSLFPPLQTKVDDKTASVYPFTLSKQERLKSSPNDNIFNTCDYRYINLSIITCKKLRINNNESKWKSSQSHTQLFLKCGIRVHSDYPR